jgi:hypothetical protein
MSSADILLDNPILVKHLRTRLRRQPLLLWLSTVMILCLGIVWAGQAWNVINNGAAFTFLLGLQTVVLGFIGASQIGGAVGGARESGIIDFHRVSPLPPLWMAIGYFFGAPIREYVLFAATIPFSILLAVLCPLGIRGWFEMTIPLIIGAWLFHSMTLLGTLVSKKPKSPGKGAGAGIIVFALFFGQPIGSLLWYLTQQLRTGRGMVLFFGVSVPWLPLVVVYGLILTGFFLLASVRKLRAERMHPYSKRQAIAFLATLAVMILGVLWNFPGESATVLVVLYLLVLAGLVLGATITPNQMEYARGLRRALRDGQRRPSVWSDEGINRWAILAMAGIVFLASTLAWEAIAGRAIGGAARSQFSQTIVIGVLVVAYVGLGLQYFLLRFAKLGGSLMAMFLFLVWLLPILLGSISFGVGNHDGLYQVVLATSPITGIALSSGIAENPGTEVDQALKLAALVPAITFAFVFNFLLEATQRKLDRKVREGVSPLKQPTGPFDDLVGETGRLDLVGD